MINFKKIATYIVVFVTTSIVMLLGGKKIQTQFFPRALGVFTNEVSCDVLTTEQYTRLYPSNSVGLIVVRSNTFDGVSNIPVNWVNITGDAFTQSVSRTPKFIFVGSCILVMTNGCLITTAQRGTGAIFYNIHVPGWNSGSGPTHAAPANIVDLSITDLRLNTDYITALTVLSDTSYNGTSLGNYTYYYVRFTTTYDTHHFLVTGSRDVSTVTSASITQIDDEFSIDMDSVKKGFTIASGSGTLGQFIIYHVNIFYIP